MASVRCLRSKPTRIGTWCPHAGPRVACANRCAYHSNSEVEGAIFSPIESTILNAALSHVPDLGFSYLALRTGARDAGYLDVSPTVLRRGPFDIVRYHLVRRRLALREEVLLSDSSDYSRTLSSSEIATRVRTLVLQRLRGNEHIVRHWQNALAFAAQPANAPIALAELAALADDVWYLSGDQTVDFSWYSRRGALAAVYASAELFQTTDRSPGFRDTTCFVDRRLDEMHRTETSMTAAKEWLAFTGRAMINVARSKTMPI